MSEGTPMDLNSPQVPYSNQRARRGSSSFINRIGRSLPLHGIGAADWMQAISIVVSAAVIWIALYYTR